MSTYGNIKKFKPTTPGVRGRVDVSRDSDVTKKKKLLKSLVSKKKSTSCRNNQGRMTVRSRGGAHKRHLRLVDFKRIPADSSKPAEFVVKDIQYDPNRTAYLALICCKVSGKYSYILAPHGLKIGQTVKNSLVNVTSYNDGDCLPLRHIPTSKSIYCIEMKPLKGAQLARSAGQYAQLLSKEGGKYAILKLKSGEMRKVLLDCRACVGVASNPKHQNRKLGKAGANRWRGKKPHVRGVAMNPVDHPHGGGEGRTSGGRHPVSPNGIPTKGYKTRSNKRTSKYIVRDRRRK